MALKETIDGNLIRDAVFFCRCDPAWHTHYSEDAKKAIARLHEAMDPCFFDMDYGENDPDEKL